MNSQYIDAPDGLAGNDDGGQMSAWYVMSALGFYQVTPGVPEYWLGVPRFDDLTVHLPNGKRLHICATGAGSGKENVTRVMHNGVNIPGYKIRHEDLMSGGELNFVMGDDEIGPIVSHPK